MEMKGHIFVLHVWIIGCLRMSENFQCHKKLLRLLELLEERGGMSNL